MSSGPQNKPEPDPKGLRPDAVTPLALTWKRFRRHRVAGLSLTVLGALIFVTAFAEFFAPYPRDWKNLDFAFAPPQPPSLKFWEGWFVTPMAREIDPVTLKSSYREISGDAWRLGFFVRGEPYKLWGLIPGERRFFGLVEPAEPGASSAFYLLGADEMGRDLFSRLIFGARVSLSVGLVAVAFILFLGVLLGGISGFLGGFWDSVVQRGIEILNALPQLPMWLAFAAVLPATWSPLQIYFAVTVILSLLGWTELARVVRGKALSLREEPYVAAAQVLGVPPTRILTRHILPGMTSHILVAASLAVPAMILGETALSFLGIGLRSPEVSWGVMLQDCMELQTLANYPWLLMPVLPIILTVLAFNFVGDGLRDAADPTADQRSMI